MGHGSICIKGKYDPTVCCMVCYLKLVLIKMEAATAIARLDRQPPLYLSVDWTGTQEERDHWKKV